MSNLSTAVAASDFDAAAKSLDQAFCLKTPCVGVRFKDDTLVVAAPQESWPAIEAEAAKENLKVLCVEGNENEILDLLHLVYEEKDGKSLEKYATVTGDAPVSQLVDQLIESAVFSRASDLHIEPFNDLVRIRIRVDGKLRVLTELPINLAPAIASRIKVLSQLNIVERRRPQDGQFTSMVGTRRVDIRVASTATLYGEKIVLRLHDERRPLVGLHDLGMSLTQEKSFSRAVNAINGLILSAGPTGSGKTTTLHSALRAAASPDKNVTTIEDPVEYVVPGINQIPVSDANNTGFAVQLRAILRQDPDVILVGETRDAETARISIQAALTGHLVLSSIHATDAVGAVYRLVQMDIEPFLVASALRSVVSQRLVRRICRFCREGYTPTSTEMLTLESYELAPKQLFRGVGCAFCGGSGYRDRVAAYQVLDINETLAEAISSRPDPVEFRRLATEQGLTTIAYQAVVLASEGTTTLEEAMEFVGQNE